MGFSWGMGCRTAVLFPLVHDRPGHMIVCATGSWSPARVRRHRSRPAIFPGVRDRHPHQTGCAAGSESSARVIRHRSRPVIFPVVQPGVPPLGHNSWRPVEPRLARRPLSLSEQQSIECDTAGPDLMMVRVAYSRVPWRIFGCTCGLRIMEQFASLDVVRVQWVFLAASVS